MGKTNTKRCWYQHEHFHATRSASNSKAKTYVPPKTILETGGRGAPGRSQGFMRNQFFKKSIVLKY